MAVRFRDEAVATGKKQSNNTVEAATINEAEEYCHRRLDDFLISMTEKKCCPKELRCTEGYLP